MTCTFVEDETIQAELASLIFGFYGIEISDNQRSLFGEPYYLSAEMFVYILIEASKKYNFKIDSHFVGALTDYSVKDFASAIVRNRL